jgi:GSH-dependent disulfide-bond oxidoreductase
MARPIELFYWPTPNGKKITIALDEMGLPYEIRPVNIGAGDQFKPDFLAISPNNRMPAIIDPDGPGGEPVSVFESGAILAYLARKTGRFHGSDERSRIAVEEWLFWQMAGVGPMAGQAHHFRMYAPSILADSRMTAYGATRYTNEVHRLYGVLNRRLDGRQYVAGDYSIADMAIFPWTLSYAGQGIDLNEFPHMKAWFERMQARPAVKKAEEVAATIRRPPPDANTKEAQAARAVLFGQRAR